MDIVRQVTFSFSTVVFTTVNIVLLTTVFKWFKCDGELRLSFNVYLFCFLIYGICGWVDSVYRVYFYTVFDMSKHLKIVWKNACTYLCIDTDKHSEVKITFTC